MTARRGVHLRLAGRRQGWRQVWRKVWGGRCGGGRCEVTGVWRERYVEKKVWEKVHRKRFGGAGVGDRWGRFGEVWEGKVWEDK